MGWNTLPDARNVQAAPAAVMSANGAVRQATQQLISLRNKATAAQERKAHLEAERSELAYSAHGAGDRAAKKRLAEIHLEISQHDSELASILAAIEEGERRLVSANNAVAIEARRGEAHRALELATAMREAGNLAAEALAAFLGRYEKFRSMSDDLTLLSVGHPSGGVVRVAMARTVANALSQVALGQILPPSERHTVEDLADRRARQVELRARQILGEGEEAA
jgi:hypothetical protein